MDYHQGMVQYHLPECPEYNWSYIFGVMEDAKGSNQAVNPNNPQKFNIEDYSVSHTTLEQVALDNNSKMLFNLYS